MLMDWGDNYLLSKTSILTLSCTIVFVISTNLAITLLQNPISEIVMEWDSIKRDIVNLEHHPLHNYEIKDVKIAQWKLN